MMFVVDGAFSNIISPIYMPRVIFINNHNNAAVIERTTRKRNAFASSSITKFTAISFHQQVLKSNGITTKHVKVHFMEDAVHPALFTVLPKNPGTVNPGSFLLKIVGHP